MAAEPESETSAGSGLPTVLVVDDVPYMRELASLFLSRTCRVVAAGSGAEALAIVRADPPDLIVSDLRMPELNGVDLCRALAREPALADIPFVMLVADDTGVERGRAIRAGANDVLPKPLSRVSLIDAVSRLLRGVNERGLPRVPLDVPVSLLTLAAGAHAGRDPGRDAEVAGVVPEQCDSVEGLVSRERAVQLRDRAVQKGMLRNLSRGGVFVETECELGRQAEVELRFRLPGSPDLLSPSAQVVWERRVRGRDGLVPGSAGFGLRFLEIDSAASRTVDDFVHERVLRAPPDAGESDANVNESWRAAR